MYVLVVTSVIANILYYTFTYSHSHIDHVASIVNELKPKEDNIWVGRFMSVLLVGVC